MPPLALHLLGPLRVERDGEEIHIGRRKARALLAYLAVTARSHRRESLAALLWPEYDQRSARAELRRALSALRRALGEGKPSPSASLRGLIHADLETVGLNPDAELWLDVQQFQGLLRACREHGHPQTDVCEACLPLLAEAAQLYQDDFLAGFSLRDSLQFDDWQFFQAESLRNELANALERLVRGHAERKDYETAITYARRRVALDPLHEPAQRGLMCLYAWSGQRAAALRQYAECARTLDEELGASPEEETTALFQAIKAGRELPPSAEIPAVPQPIATDRSRHNLPVQLTPFIGREALLAEIVERLEDPGCRLLTLVGPGGCGKTRLALEAASSRLDANAHEHGVFFVSLAPLESADAQSPGGHLPGIVPTVAAALGFSLPEGSNPRQALLAYLRGKEMLLVLDNFEHLLAPALPPASHTAVEKERETPAAQGGEALLIDILHAAPEVTILVTSRASLNVAGGLLFHMPGMAFPETTTTTVEESARYGAVKLFAERARWARRDFELTADNQAHVAQICRLVQGMPLGVILAAGWVTMLAPSEIAEQIAGEVSRGLDFLTTDARDVPARQRSVRATLDHSWNMLTPREREVMGALSVFRGGFTRRAARRVAGAPLRDLKGLADKSLLARSAKGRYELHELLRQYAAEKLAREPAAVDAVRDRHSAHYAAALARWASDFKGPRQQQALEELRADLENARAAWDWAVAGGRVTRLEQALAGLCLYYAWVGRHEEGEAACRAAREKLTPSASTAEELKTLARIWTWQGAFTRILGRTEPARQLLQDSLQLLNSPELVDQDTRADKARALRELGLVAHVTGDYEQEGRVYEKSLALYRSVDDRWETAYTLERLGKLSWSHSRYEDAQRFYGDSLEMRRSLGDQKGMADSLLGLSRSVGRAGRPEEGARLAREGIALHRKLGDRVGVTDGRFQLGIRVLELGEFDEACSLLEQVVARYEELGVRLEFGSSRYYLAWAKEHLGFYDEARALHQANLGAMKGIGSWPGAAMSMAGLGRVALAEEACAEAQRLLEESVAVWHELWPEGPGEDALCWLALAARGLGQLPQAQGFFDRALWWAVETGTRGLFSDLAAMSTVALLLADRGRVERAVELYALASRYPFVANSRWFEDVAGKHIAAAAEKLSPQVVAAAQERGRARDLRATVAELLEDH